MKKIVLIAAICVSLPFMYVGKVSIICRNSNGIIICNDSSDCSWGCFESDHAICLKDATQEHMSCIHNSLEEDRRQFCSTNSECGFKNATLFKGMTVECTIKRDDSPGNTDNQHTTKAPTDQGCACPESNSQNANGPSDDKTFTLDATSFVIGFVICLCLGASAWAIHFFCCKKHKPNSAPGGGRIWNRVPQNPPGDDAGENISLNEGDDAGDNISLNEVRTKEGGASSSSPGQCEAESTSPMMSTSAV